MPCPLSPAALPATLRAALNWLIMRLAWLAGDWFGWRAPLAVLPPQLVGRTAVVAGANAGLGFETTQALLQQGATVVMACRSLEAGAAARSAILARPGAAGPAGDAASRLIVLHLDLEDFASIKAFAEAFRALRRPLHLLVNNAGAPRGARSVARGAARGAARRGADHSARSPSARASGARPRRRLRRVSAAGPRCAAAGVHLKPHKVVPPGVERTMASNFVGPVMLTLALLPELTASAPARCVRRRPAAGPRARCDRARRRRPARAPRSVVNVASVSELLWFWYTLALPLDDLRGRRLPDSGERAYVISKARTRRARAHAGGSAAGAGAVGDAARSRPRAVHPGIADTTWYLKSDDRAYLFSWLIARARALLPALRVGQPAACAALSTIYASLAPELAGATSTRASAGPLDAAARALFGGRLRYFGPSYAALVALGPFANFRNTGRVWAVNPWVYSRAACKRLYDAALALTKELGAELDAASGGGGAGGGGGDGERAGGQKKRS
ncbi:RDH12 [Scenedesmus sp. PABB004]|nr:RDH12 [Scenedesmus sp. PABB004]